MPHIVALLGTDENFVTSPNGNIVYVAGNDGSLRAYDVATGTLIFRWLVGYNLDGIAISRDGAYAIITEAVPVSVQHSNNWPSNVSVVAVYRINLQTGVTQTFEYTATGSSYTFGDVAFTDDGTVLLSQNILPGWSGWTSMVSLNLTSGAFATHGSYYAGLGSVASLTQADVAGTALVGQLGLSSAEYFLLNNNGIAVDNNGGSYANGVYGYAAGIEAFNGVGTSGRVAVATGGGLHLYDGDFNYLANLISYFPDLTNTTGLTFSQDSSVLYAIDAVNDRIIGISMTDFFQVSNISLGDYSYQVLGMGDELILSPNNASFLVATTSGILHAANTTTGGRTDGADVIFGTPGADRLSGGLGDDTISGFAGSDLIDGGAGSNTVNGGAGNDRILLSSAGSGSIIDGGSDFDTLVVSGSVSLAGLAGIEAVEFSPASNLTLTGSQFAYGLANDAQIRGSGTITVNMDAGVAFVSNNLSTSATTTFVVNGSASADVIKCFGTVHVINAGDGNDQIRGGSSADTINGGTGNDKIMGSLGADVLTGGTGNDQFRYFAQNDSGLGAAADRITDYTIGGDKLNFLLIDADAAMAGDQAFSFIGTTAFAATGIGQIRYTNSGADLLVQADVNGDGVADMEIILQGLNGGTLTAGDFIL